MSDSQRLSQKTNQKAEESAATAKAPKVALVCDWLTTPGGAEKVLLELHQMYPQAPIYTSQYRPKKIDWFDDAEVKTGWLQIFPVFLRKMLGPLRQLYFSHLDLSDYDLVISVTGAEAKAVKTKKNLDQKEGLSSHYSTHEQKSQEENAQKGNSNQKNAENSEQKGAFHICYCHVPTQYYWQFYDRYMENPGFGILNPLFRLGLRVLSKPLRRADYRAARGPDQFVAISSYAARQIRKYYDRSSVVIAPPVAVGNFRPQEVDDRGGFVISCRQVSWKRVDLAIKACLATGNQLTVIGDGPEHNRLRDLADGSFLIKFVPWLSTERLTEYLCTAEGYIFPSIEPFGIAPVEALAAGCPVVAYGRGGSRDFVEAGKNGIFFGEQTVESLVSALEDFEQYDFDEQIVSATAQKFSPERFRGEIVDLILECIGTKLEPVVVKVPKAQPQPKGSDQEDKQPKARKPLPLPAKGVIIDLDAEEK